jgi:hypothetical protein
MIGSGCKYWNPVMREPIETFKREIAACQGPEESLLRASDAPTSQQPVELLRAAGTGIQTPADELLRSAFVEGSQDI